MRKVLFLSVLLLVMLLGTTMVFAADVGSTNVDIDGMLDALTPFGILGLLTFLVQVVVQVTKGLPRIRNVPTDLYVIVISLVFCEFALFAYAAWHGMTVYWYYVGLAVLASLVVSYISMFGWGKLYDLWMRWGKYKE
jgi:ABC-type transport system involved in cytochrome c biogenesis permease subunit